MPLKVNVFFGQLKHELFLTIPFKQLLETFQRIQLLLIITVEFTKETSKSL